MINRLLRRERGAFYEISNSLSAKLFPLSPPKFRSNASANITIFLLNFWSFRPTDLSRGNGPHSTCTNIGGRCQGNTLLSPPELL
ncbi:hypothetical protein NPIL_198571 [Nephila pilipes]|uniref:Uncharacterized protein n=1 Tax=Nephila pilipes TaxID=299642 RepID=A0A8X6Q431_NEPPI|nr:hypothetical protein NPIL_198571 [Nephila pilipes]